MDNVVAVILAGGRGERLSVLTEERAKPAIPFAGKYRIIDFTLSNCVNSQIRHVAILTQYQPLSFIEHIGVGAPWYLDRPDCKLSVIQAYLAGRGRGWYKGTADAVYQNLGYIQEQDCEYVLILSGDHIYAMNYSDMFDFHREVNADLTLAVTRMPEEELYRFGTVIVDDAWNVTGFQEKIRRPKGNLVSMGVYLFKKSALQMCLEEDAQDVRSRHDFGRNIVPRMVEENRVFSWFFDGYWRDVGTVQTYWQTSMDLLGMSPSPLFNASWPIRTKEEERPAAIITETAEMVNSLIASGCVIEGRVEHSILSPGVLIAEGATVKDSIIMHDCVIGQGSVINYSILDKEVKVEAGCHIGFGDDFQTNHRHPRVMSSGITVLGKRATIPLGVKIGRNCVICSGVTDSDFVVSEIQSGETVATKNRHHA
jgi:glucose-1-phosphate adenylyltransferase